MTVRIVRPDASRIRATAARLHPNSEVRFVLFHEDGTQVELDLAALDFSQEYETNSKGIESPTAAPSMTVLLTARPVKAAPFPEKIKQSWDDHVSAMQGETGKAINMREKAPPNSGDMS